MEINTSIFRYILDRLIYEDEYDEIDENLTDSNVGCRKGRNIRDNIFIVGAIVNSVTKKDSEPNNLQIYDIATAFDKLGLKESIIDLY